MELSTAISQLNWLAIIASALSTFVIGGLWYSPLLFQKGWMKENNFTREDPKRLSAPAVFGLSFILSLIMSLNLALFIGDGNIIYGVIAGFLAGFGWVALAIGILSLFENRSLKYFLINGGYMVVSFTLMGLILGAWK